MISIPLSALLLATSAVCVAGDPVVIACGLTSPSVFQQLDVNHDSGITRNEIKDGTWLKEKFRIADTDRNGRISIVEYYDAERNADPSDGATKEYK